MVGSNMPHGAILPLLVTAAALLAIGCGRTGFDELVRATSPGDHDGEQTPAFPVGTVVLHEPFEDGDFSTRGWFDGSRGVLIADPTAPSGGSAYTCTFAGGGCPGGRPGRFAFAPSDSLYLSYWVRYSADFSGAFEIYVHTDVDDALIGPASSRLSISVASEAGDVYIRMEDNENVDPACVRQSDGTVNGCTGYTFDTYPFGETRSVCACNGILGDLDVAECFTTGADRYFSRRYWYSSQKVFTSGPPHAATRWHFVELYLRMSSIAGGVGIADGSIAYARDGEVLIEYDHILMHTAEYPTMRFSQIMLNPVYARDGEEIWIDELTVGTGG